MAGGIGGGGIIVPINLIFLNFAFSNAVALSKISIFAGSLIRYISETCLKSPLKGEEQKPLVDYYTAMILEPPLLAGTVLGVLINIWFPEWFLLLLLILTLG